ncbi:hypothetical protein VCRA2116O29_60140 [Vibrio crassostreae]|nr:hypothetical protein VCRA2119O48_140020 [Vibrio crassostreae]CAK2532437.1 hypothetical protein VCRA2116O29_60140 [Vibrio crassostreae]CAK3780720.1 hypothetical protein VCRA212O16_140096 [Vibrio crassostreae]CAK3915987.1 hypothetical protein VCRA2123O74_70140 [Vibrio crassostreae]
MASIIRFYYSFYCKKRVKRLIPPNFLLMLLFVISLIQTKLTN